MQSRDTLREGVISGDAIVLVIFTPSGKTELTCVGHLNGVLRLGIT